MSKIIIGENSRMGHSLRKVFASLGRTPSTRTDGCSPLRRSHEPPQLARTSRDGNKGGSHLEGTSCSANSGLDDDLTVSCWKPITESIDLDKSVMGTHGTDCRGNSRRSNYPDTHNSKSTEEESNRSSQQETTSRNLELEGHQVAKGAETFGLRGTEEAPSDALWTFETMLVEQRRKEVQHEARKECTFRRGDRDLALQREALMQRHHPGSEDNVGEDPLATSPAQSTKSPARNAFDSAGPIRLELGMDAEKLEKILDELEESTAAGGYRQTNSELSRILDFLDEAAGDAPAAATLPLDAQGGRQ
eukprot:jgi/Undpi1/5805/HiC_scaffold_2.g01079.m1